MPMSMREVLHAPHHGLSKRQLSTLQHWLPAIVAELLLLVAFLAWFQHRGPALHGDAVVYAWSVYGLIALGLLFLWFGPETGRHAPGRGARRGWRHRGNGRG